MRPVVARLTPAPVRGLAWAHLRGGPPGPPSCRRSTAAPRRLAAPPPGRPAAPGAAPHRPETGPGLPPHWPGAHPTARAEPRRAGGWGK